MGQNNRALLCRDTGKFPEALDAHECALKKEPDSPQLLNDCAVILHYHLKSAENLAKARRLTNARSNLLRSSSPTRRSRPNCANARNRH